jgi:hypothetical protein
LPSPKNNPGSQKKKSSTGTAAASYHRCKKTLNAKAGHTVKAGSGLRIVGPFSFSPIAAGISNPKPAEKVRTAAFQEDFKINLADVGHPNAFESRDVDSSCGVEV